MTSLQARRLSDSQEVTLLPRVSSAGRASSTRSSTSPTLGLIPAGWPRTDATRTVSDRPRGQHEVRPTAAVLIIERDLADRLRALEARQDELSERSECRQQRRASRISAPSLLKAHWTGIGSVASDFPVIMSTYLCFAGYFHQITSVAGLSVPPDGKTPIAAPQGGEGPGGFQHWFPNASSSGQIVRTLIRRVADIG